MTDKAYIVANEQQEHEVLEKLEHDGLVWIHGGEKPTKFIPSKQETEDVPFPYAVINQGKVTWEFEFVVNLKNIYEIVFDGRKEEQMSDKYIVSQEFMNELEEWKLHTVVGVFINDEDISKLPIINYDWWHYQDISAEECNNRLIAIIRWVNGEDVFEVEKPKKWVVRSKETDSGNDHVYLTTINIFGIKTVKAFYSINKATKFDTKEEAGSWANSHQEVVEVVDV